MILSSPSAPTAPIRFDFDFNPVSPWFGKGPSEMQVEVDGDHLPYVRFSDTQNPNIIRPGTEWLSNAAFRPTGDSYAAVLREAAAALASVPGDAPETDYTKNGHFELKLGDTTWTGSLLSEKRGPVRDA